MNSISSGIAEIGYIFFKSKESLSKKIFRFFFRVQFCRNIVRYIHDNKFKVPKSKKGSPDSLLKKNGYLVQHFNLSNSFLDQIKELTYIEDISKKTFKNYDDVVKFKGKRSHVRYTCKKPHTKSKLVDEFSQSPEIRKIVESYLGKDAILMDSMSWVSIGQALKKNNFEFGFHMDQPAWKWLNVFIYLTDVEKENGAHSCIKSTHKNRHLLSFIERRLDYNRAIKLYGKDRIQIFTGLKGTAIFEDTGNYHRALPVVEGHRFLLQLNYSNYKNFSL